MNRIAFAFRSFFSLLFSGTLPADIARASGYSSAKPAAAPKPAPQVRTADGALQMLAILQRDSRLIDFLMEDISVFDDEQVGAAVRDMHKQAREALTRHVQLGPVIDGVEGTFTKLDSADPHAVKLLGNVPPSGKAAGGTLRHRGWRANTIDLPPLRGTKPDVLAPAEVEVE